MVQHDLHIDNAFAYWRMDPDFEAEIYKRAHAAKDRGEKYTIDEAEAKDIVATVGKKEASLEFKKEAEAVKDAVLAEVERND